MHLTASPNSCLFIRTAEIDQNFNIYLAGLRQKQIPILQSRLNDPCCRIDLDPTDLICSRWDNFTYSTGRILLKMSSLLSAQPKLNKKYRFFYIGIGHSTVRISGSLESEHLSFSVSAAYNCHNKTNQKIITSKFIVGNSQI